MSRGSAWLTLGVFHHESGSLFLHLLDLGGAVGTEEVEHKIVELHIDTKDRKETM